MKPSPDTLYADALERARAGDIDGAFALHREAAVAGHPSAQLECARMLLYGMGTEAAPALALTWLERAEQAGHPAAACLLALLGLGGVLVPRDARINARTGAAVAAGFAPAMLAAAVHFGRKPNPADQALCLNLLERAAEKGETTAALLLAERLRYGEGCAVDTEAATSIDTQLRAYGIDPLPELHAEPAYSPRCEPRTLALEDVFESPPHNVLSLRPPIAYFSHALSADECRLLIACARPHLRPSRTADPETGQSVEVPVRTSSEASFEPVLESLSLRLIQMRLAVAAGRELLNGEHLTVLRYAPGQQYFPHRDYLPPSTIERDHPQAGNRARTICVYLNDVEAGGGTAFPVPGIEISPKAGRAVVFDNLHPDGTPDPDSLHAGLPVERGEKWLATLWIRERRYRDF